MGWDRMFQNTPENFDWMHSRTHDFNQIDSFSFFHGIFYVFSRFPFLPLLPTKKARHVVLQEMNKVISERTAEQSKKDEDGRNSFYNEYNENLRWWYKKICDNPWLLPIHLFSVIVTNVVLWSMPFENDSVSKSRICHEGEKYKRHRWRNRWLLLKESRIGIFSCTISTYKRPFWVT